jgi:hypothetical protein
MISLSTKSMPGETCRERRRLVGEHGTTENEADGLATRLEWDSAMGHCRAKTKRRNQASGQDGSQMSNEQYKVTL